MPLMQGPPGPVTVLDGREYLYFAGTGYLGLQGRPEVVQAACDAARQYGLGSATSRGGFGDTPPVVEVERRAARFLGTEDAFYFAGGYAGPWLVVSGLEGSSRVRETHHWSGAFHAPYEAVFVDECSHYAVRDAAHRAGAPVFPFPHRDVAALADALRRHLRPGARPLVMTDGVFAALGTIAPVAGYCELLSAREGAVLLIDDAHGVGVLGERGRGTAEHAGLSIGAGPAPDSPARVRVCATASKALGGFGGIVPGGRDFVENVKTRSHWFRGASAPPPPVAAATAKGIEIAAAEPQLRERLGRNARLLRQGLRAMGLQADDSPVPIVSLTLGDEANMRRIQQTLMDRGVAVAHMHYAGLGPHGALRIAVFATHTEEMIGRLVEELRAVV